MDAAATLLSSKERSTVHTFGAAMDDDDGALRRADGLLEAALAACVLSPDAAAQMRQRMREGRLRPDICVKACESRLGYRASHPLETEPEPQPESQPQPQWEPPIEAVVRECLRCLVVETEQRVEKGPAYSEPVECYQQRPGKPLCQHGAMCRQESGWHWFHYDHPREHSLISAPPREFAALATWRLASVPPCRHFTKTGSCLYGDRCRFEHAPRCPQAPAAVGLPWDPSPAPTNVAAAAVAHPSRQRRTGRNPRKNRSNYGPTANFRRFLVETFGIDKLREGGGVLDVAGGAGTLSYELLHLNGVQSTIADPRRPCFKRAQKTVAHRRRQNQMHLEEGPVALQRYDNALAPGGGPAASTRGATPESEARVGSEQDSNPDMTVADENHLTEGGTAVVSPEDFPAWAQVWFGKWLWDVPDGAPPGSPPKTLFSKDVKQVDSWDHTRDVPAGSRKIEDSAGDGRRRQQEQVEGDQVGNEQPAGAIDAPVSPALRPLTPEGVSRALAECSVVIGLHPDGATDAIVDFALQHGKPFALLPCCVYRKHFPERRTPSGESVKTYEDLLDYLEARSDGIRRASLGFDGRNVVLYRTQM